MNPTTVDRIQISSIIVGERFRKEFDTSSADLAGKMSELIHSIKEEGLIHPIAVCPQDGGYLLLAGERRLRAVQELIKSNDWPDTSIPANIFDSTLSELDKREIELAENLQRKDMEWAEEVALKKEIHTLMVAKHGLKVSTSPNAAGHSIRDTAAMLGESSASTIRDISLANALDQFPELKNAKTKGDAQKILSTLNKKANRSQVAAAAEARVAGTPIGELKKAIMSAYQVGNFFDLVKKEADNSYGIVEIDPPYSINLQGQKRDYANAYVGDGYEEIAPDAYEEFMGDVLREAYRICRPDGWLILWFGPDPWFSTLLYAAKQVGFRVRGIPGIWDKGSGQTMHPELYLANSYEMFFYGTKESGQVIKQGRSNVFSFKPVPATRKTHPTERPIELIQELISVFTMEHVDVYVPFLGSGNTILAAANLKMRATGCDLNDVYRKDFIIKVDQSEPGRYSSYVRVAE